MDVMTSWAAVAVVWGLVGAGAVFLTRWLRARWGAPPAPLPVRVSPPDADGRDRFVP